MGMLVSNAYASRDAGNQLIMNVQAGGVIVPYITTPFNTWSTLLFLLTLHLFLNYKAVRAVSMHSLNRQRTGILMSNLISGRKILTPSQVSQQEQIFSRGALLKWKSHQPTSTCEIGVSLQKLLQSIATASSHTGAFKDLDVFPKLCALFRKHQYILWYDQRTSSTIIVLKQEAGTLDQIRAWTHALVLAENISKLPRDKPYDAPWLMSAIGTALEATNLLFDTHLAAIRSAGWDLSIPHLETRSGTRISFKQITAQ